jgi:hypothetical protein
MTAAIKTAWGISAEAAKLCRFYSRLGLGAFAESIELTSESNIRSDAGMANRIRIIPHEVVPKCGSFEVRFPDGRPSRYFYWDDVSGTRLRPDLADSATRDARTNRSRNRSSKGWTGEAPTIYARSRLKFVGGTNALPPGSRR